MPLTGSAFCHLPVAVLFTFGLHHAAATASAPGSARSAEQDRNQSSVFLEHNIDRPLRYTPDGSDFVITNGGEFFNRSLYGGSSAFRADAGDRPEFSLYLPGRGGNLRLGIRSGPRVKWLHEADQVVARYRPGMMVYEVRDALLDGGGLRISALATRSAEGLLLRCGSSAAKAELVFAFGGLDGLRGRRDGDIGCEPEPVSRFFRFRPERCDGNTIFLGKNSFAIRGKPGLVGGVLSGDGTLRVAHAAQWSTAEMLLKTALEDAGKAAFRPQPLSTTQPVVCGSVDVPVGEDIFIGLQRLASATDAEKLLSVYRAVSEPGVAPAESEKWPQWRGADLQSIFEREEAERREVAGRVVVETPDPFVNTAVPALNVAADAVWDDRQRAYLHGGVAWRVRLLGWRVAYAGNALGWHDRTAQHFEGFARQQNTNPVPSQIPAPEESANLSRNETALHSNGNMTKSHYDMNLVGVDTFFRHLLWTGDLVYARRLWPVIERHLAWERRLFRREFGPEKLPLYEGYCCIWASDDLAYNGGGATHSSAYNLFHNRMAARVAKLLGFDPGLYEREADQIARAMQKHLWLRESGWYAEWKDWLGLQQVHPNAATWTFYHTVDSRVPSPREAWQMTRFVDTQIARIPLRGPGVPPGSCTLPTTSWMPYTWSLNNVVLAETMHTALGYWQANRPEAAFPLFKGALLDSMYLGLCPGNVGMCTWFDAYRRESQRDFGDGVGSMSRALVEGLFGIEPALLSGDVTIRPGFPADWQHASIRHPDFQFSFQRNGLSETYLLRSGFARAVRLRLQVAALRDHLPRVTVNGEPAPWRVIEDSVDTPRIEIETAPGARHEVTLQWSGEAIAKAASPVQVALGGTASLECTARVLELADPQGALRRAEFERTKVRGVAAGAAGHRTLFAKVEQGQLRWWQALPFEIRSNDSRQPPMDWTRPVTARVEPIDLAPVFNDRLTQIFKNEYREPRSPFCSLATPKQGIGSWCHPHDSFEVDDSGLRARAAAGDGRLVLPNGVPLSTPPNPVANNVVFVSQWHSYPSEVSLPLDGRSSRAFLLMAGSTGAMQSRFDNGEVVFTYTDGSSYRLALHNPTTWWPIDQDFYIDDFAFRRPEPLPLRVDLKSGRVRVLDPEGFKGTGREIPGGAATVLAISLNSSKDLKSLTVRALANEVVIGLLSVTLER